MNLAEHLNVIGPAIALFVGSGAVLLIGLVSPARAYSFTLTCLSLIVAVVWLAIHHIAGTESIALGGSVRIDAFSNFFSIVIVVATLSIVLATRTWADTLERSIEFYALLLTAAASMTILTQASDLITIFIAIETTSISQFILVAIVKDDKGAEAGLKYLLTGAVAAAVLLYGFVFLFGVSGVVSLDQILNFAESAPEEYRLVLLLSLMFIVAGLGYKMALAPFHGWAPDVYQGAPSAIGSFLSVASKATGFAVALRLIYSGLGGGDFYLATDLSRIFVILAVASMIIGNLGALRQTDAKRLLGYSSIAQAGNIAVGLAALTAGSVSGASAVTFFAATYLFTNLGAFLSVHFIRSKLGSSELTDFAGLIKRSPLVAVVLSISLLSLTGIPPTAGFIAKVYIFNAAITGGDLWLVGLVAVAVLNTAISAYYYLRWLRMMWLDEPSEDSVLRPDGWKQTVLVSMMAGILLIGILPNPLINAAKTAVESLV